jgi:membrane protease YdiL (CAAX protease family)
MLHLRASVCYNPSISFHTGVQMDPVNLLGIGLVLAFVIYIIVIANRNPVFSDGNIITGMLWSLLAINLALGVLAFTNAILGSAGTLPLEDTPAISLPVGITSLFIAGLVTFVGALSIRSTTFRMRLQRTLGSHAQYNPGSALHTTALVLILLLISSNLITFFLAGGIQGMANSISEDGIAFSEVLFQQFLWILASALGVGLFTRRTLSAVLERLKLRLPTLSDIGAGVLAAIGAYILAILIALAWAMFSSPEQFAEQTAASQQITAAIGSLPLAFAIAVAVAIGEEVLFRGALQPIFGNLLTSIFFAIIHTQYALTPATAIIFFVSLLFGWLRQRYSTTSAIIAHFVYNFIQLALAIMASNLTIGAS